jgi:hypothetical protein
MCIVNSGAMNRVSLYALLDSVPALLEFIAQSAYGSFQSGDSVLFWLKKISSKLTIS